jgi:hypothetical protein
MTFEELDKNFDKTIKQIKTDPTIMVKLGISALTFIKERVIEKGTDASGRPYKSYSTKPMLVGCKSFVQKSACAAMLGSKSKRKELEWRTVKGHKLAILPGGYKELREKQGRQTNHVDFSVTNEMWNDINIISKRSEHQGGTVIIGAKKESEKKKLEGNTKRRGDILDLSKSELDDLQLVYNLKVLEIFKENGL